MLSVLHFLEARPHRRFHVLVLNFGCYDLSKTCSMRDSNHPKPLLSKDMVARFRNAFLPNTTSEQHWHASKLQFANLKAHRDEGRLLSTLFEPGTEDLLLGDTGSLSSSCNMERRTDFSQSAREDE